MSSEEKISGDDEELPQKYGETEMKRLPLSQFQITFEHGCTTMYNNTEKFIGSYCLLDDKKAKSGKYKYFVLDSTDIDCWLAEKKNDEKCLESLDNFMVKFPNKKLYLRHILHDGSEYFFTDELWELISILLLQQNAPREVFEDIKNFGTAFKFDLMESEYLDVMLDKFEVDKSLITIIPEFEFEYTRNSHLKNGLRPVHYVNRDGCRVVSPGQAMYTVFQNVVCGTNWNLNYCSQHPNCRSDCRNTILNAMQNCVNTQIQTQIAMVPLDTVMKSVNEIKALCHLHNKPDLQNLDCFYEDKGPDNSVAIDKYMQAVKMYGLYPPSLLMQQQEKNLVLPTFLVRALMMCGWMQSFFKSDCPNLRRIVYDELLSLLPEGTRDSLEPSMREITFAPYSHNEITQLSSNTIPVATKLAADRERRTQKLLEKKKQKNKNKEQPIKVEEKKTVGIPKDKSVFRFVKSWIDHSERADLAVHVGLVQVGFDVYASNHAILHKEPQNTDGMNYFFISQADYLKYAKTCGPPDCMYNQETASLFFSIVVRAIKTTTGNYVLCNEILEIIPLLMEKQKIPPNVYETKLRNYRDKWDFGSSEVLSSVNVSFFKAILDDLNVDRSLITIIPDSHHYMSHTEIINRVVPFLFTMINWKQRIMCKEQAIFYIFHSVVCGVNWRTKSCKKNKSVVDGFKQKYFEETGKYEQMSKGTFVTEKLVEETIALLLSHEVFKEKIAHRTSDFCFAHIRLMMNIPRSEYLKKCDLYALPEFDNIDQRQYVPVALARTWIYVGWVQNFYPIEMFKSKRIVVTELQYMWNAHERESSLGHFMTLVKSSAIDREEEEQERELEKMRKLMSQTSVLNRVQKMSKPPPETPQEPTTSSEAPPEPQRSELPETPPRPETSNPPPITKTAKKKIPKQPKPCQKCTENGVALLNAREDLRKIEITAKSNEKRAKRNEQVEQGLKNTELEMEALKREIDDLRVNLKEFDGQEELAKASNARIRKDLENLEWQIESEREKSVKERRRNTMLVTNFNKTQEELVIKESERDTGAQERRQPRPVPSEGPSTYHVPFVPSLPTTDDPELAQNPNWVLEQWRQMRTDFENDDEVQNEKEMIENFIAIVEDLGSKQLAEYELYQFEGTSRIYLKHIDMNILKIEKTGDIYNLWPLAKYPCLSMEFMIEHDKLMGEN